MGDNGAQTAAANSKHHHHHNLAHRHHIRCRRLSSEGEDEDVDEELDPRIQIELEKLNRASEEINRLELELDDARAAFRQVLSDSTQRLNGLAKKLGACVEKARPYYDARMKLKEAHLESQKAALRFERACSMHEAAKEMVQLAEEGYKRRDQDLDPTWQEMLNHATMKVNDAEKERMESEEFHQQTTCSFKERDEEVQKLQKNLKRAITKSKPYFEMKAKFNQVMEEHKRAVSTLEEDVCSTKALYSHALRSLEAISDDIHRQRLERQQQLQLGVRGPGVGAEAPSPPPSWNKESTIEGSVCGAIYDSDGGDDSVKIQGGSRSVQKGIVRHDLAYPKTGTEGKVEEEEVPFPTDPLNVAVFKTVDSSAETLLKKGHQSPSASHRQVAESGLKDGLKLKGREVIGIDTVLAQSSRSEGHVADSELKRVVRREKSHSPASGHRRASNISESSLSRAQEWVNRSPVPQQRRFVKSTSLIEVPPPPSASAGGAGGGGGGGAGMASHSIDVELSSTISAELTSSADTSVMPGQSRPQRRSAPLDIKSVKVGQVPQLSSSSSPRCHSMPAVDPQRHSPLSGSPTAHRKSPKLQGLILKVEAAGMPSSSSQGQGQPRVITSSSQGPPKVISTSDSITPGQPVVVSSAGHPQTKSFEPFAEDQGRSKVIPKCQQQQPALEVPTTEQQRQTSPPSSTLPPKSSIPTEAPTSSIMSKLRQVSSHNNKAAPSTLSSSYQLQKLSPPSSSSATFPLKSPTTIPSPPTGRGESLFAPGGHKAVLLKVPSEHSSDTESIASTGPMLDDEQVEFLTMDFTEQSIGMTEERDQREFPDFHPDESSDSGGTQRGSWARMSLPPRLSYLEGFLERARHVSGNRGDDSPCSSGTRSSSVPSRDPSLDQLSSPEGLVVGDEAAAVVMHSGTVRLGESDRKGCEDSPDVSVTVSIPVGGGGHSQGEEEGSSQQTTDQLLQDGKVSAAQVETSVSKPNTKQTVSGDSSGPTL